MWHCNPKNENDQHEHIVPTLNVTLPDGKHFALPIWSVFWLIGPLLWWGAGALQVVVVALLVALVMGVRVHLDSGETAALTKRKNEDLL